MDEGNIIKAANPEELEFEGEETVDPEIRESLLAGNHSNAGDENNIYPDAKVHIRIDPMSVYQIKRKLEKTPPQLILDPEFQRGIVWDKIQKSELIESIMMGIPLPLIYVKEDKVGVYIIVDGRQRLTAIFDYIDNKYSLEHLRTLPFLNGKKFSDLDAMQQNKIEDCALTLHVIYPPTSDRVTFDLFDRVNRGGTRLNNQEMRNALYQGNATALLKELSQNENFIKATDKSINSKRMKDRYLILRFIAFYLWRKGLLVDAESDEKIEYKSDIEEFLGKSMDFLNSSLSDATGLNFRHIFDSVMQNCFELFGKDGFRLPQKEGNPRRPVNMALYETLSYFIAELGDFALSNKDQVIASYRELIADNGYIQALTSAVDSNVSIKTRFEKVENKIGELLR